MGHRGGYQQINKALNVCAFEDYLEGQLKKLPQLEDVERISPLVIRVLGQNAGRFTLQGTNTYIVGQGASRLLIDTGQGIPEWIDLISTTLEELSISLSHVLLTHWHGDHSGGVPHLLQQYPDLHNSIYKNSPSKDQQPIDDGQTFHVDGATIRAVHSPGHSHDHMCFILQEENAMFTGDNVLGHGSSAVEELSVYMSSLRMLQSHKCTIGYPAHGDVIQDLDRKIANELELKTRRENQVMRILMKQREEGKKSGNGKAGSLLVTELVTMMYGTGVGDEVREKALEPFIDEVLRKLAEDGKVAFEIRRGEKKWYWLGV